MSCNDDSDTDGTDYDYEELATPTKRKREHTLRIWTEYDSLTCDSVLSARSCPNVSLGLMGLSEE